VYVYSEYLDEFMEWRGSAKNLLYNRKIVKEFIEKYVPKEKVIKIHYGLKRELNGIFVLDIWVELKNGVTSFIAVDSPIPLNFRQWQIIASVLNRIYFKNKIYIINVKGSSEEREIMNKIMEETTIYGEEVFFIKKEYKKENLTIIHRTRCKPWNILLVFKENKKYKVFVVPRIVVEELINSFNVKGIWFN